MLWLLKEAGCFLHFYHPGAPGKPAASIAGRMGNVQQVQTSALAGTVLLSLGETFNTTFIPL